jgi:hypothetical protein
LLCRLTIPTDLFRSTISTNRYSNQPPPTDCSTTTATTVPTSYSTATIRPFRSIVLIICRYCTNRLLLTGCYQPFRSAVLTYRSNRLLLTVLLLTVLLLTILLLTIPFYLTILSICFYYYFYYRYYYCCYCYYCYYCCYCYYYYF